MRFTDLADLRDEIRPLVPDAPMPTIDRAVRRAAMKFCNVSEAIREALPALTQVVGIGVMNVSTPGDTNMVALHEARIAGANLEISSSRDVNIAYADFDTVYDTPERIYLSGDNEITIAPYPEATDAISVFITASFSPTFNATAVPTELTGIYFTSLIEGALGELYSMSDAIWANANKAKSNQNKMMAAAFGAKNRANHNSTRRTKTVKYGGI